MPIPKLLRFSFLLVLACLVSCRDKAKEDSSVVQLNFWNGFSGPDGQQMEKIIRQFNDEHRGRIEVRMQIIPWGTYYDKVTLGLAFGGAPEVFVLHVNRFPEFASHNVLGRIDDLVKRDGPPESDFVSARGRQHSGKESSMPFPWTAIRLVCFITWTSLRRRASPTRPPISPSSRMRLEG